MKQLLRFAALITIAVIVGVNLAETMRPLLPLWAGQADFVSPSEKRLAPAKEVLPTTGEIGYISRENPTDALVEPEAVRNYYITQYSLAPLVVTPAAGLTPAPNVVLGNFTGEIHATVSEVSVIHDFGSGIVVIETPQK